MGTTNLQAGAFGSQDDLPIELRGMTINTEYRRLGDKTHTERRKITSGMFRRILDWWNK